MRLPRLVVCVTIAAALLALDYAVPSALARDNGQWENSPPHVRRWFQGLRQPDNPRVSCCGEADAYYADGVAVGADGTVFAIITDERDDGPLMRPHIPVGTRIRVPEDKNKDTRADPNPTNHTVIFVKWYGEEGDYGNWGVLCYLPNGGV